MKRNTFFILLCLFSIGVSAQLPVAKVDIDMEGRKATEVNETNYTPWFLKRGASDTIVVSGVAFRLTSGPVGKTAMRTSWAKVLVQSPYYMRLVDDGVKVDNDSLIAHPKMPVSLELRIKGLPVGKHILQTYHNSWDDTSKVNFSLLDVYLNGSLVHSNVVQSVQAKQTSNATLLLTELNVAKAGQEMVLLIKADTDFIVSPGKTKDMNVYLNGFELNTDDASKQACEPDPVDGNLHVNANEQRDRNRKADRESAPRGMLQRVDDRNAQTGHSDNQNGNNGNRSNQS